MAVVICVYISYLISDLLLPVDVLYYVAWVSNVF